MFHKGKTNGEAKESYHSRKLHAGKHAGQRYHRVEAQLASYNFGSMMFRMMVITRYRTNNFSASE